MPAPGGTAASHADTPSTAAPGPVATASTPRTRATPTPALEKAATPEDGAFVLRVVDGSGPVAGAQVRAWLRLAADGSGTTPWRRAGEGTTSADGTLRLPAGPGDYLLSASAPGHGPARHEATRPLGEAETAVELSLPAGVSLEGRTVAEGRDEPVPLAEVTLRPYPGVARLGAEPVDVPEESHAVTSDARGHFAFSGLAPGRYELTAEAAGFSRRTLRLLQVPQPGELVVGLWGAGTLEGFVRDAKGQPVAGAEVSASGGLAPVSTTTGESGGFALEVQAGDWVVSARRGESAGRAPGIYSVAAGETLRGVTVTLGGASGMEGTVSSTDGAPVRGAVLVATPSGGTGVMGRATSDESGAWRLDTPPGEYDVAVRAPGMTGLEREGVVVTPGRYTPLDVRLEPATAVVEGSVVDDGGRPVARATVRARPQATDGMTRATLTGADGTYRLEGLEAGPTFLQAQREGAAQGAQQREVLKPATTTRVDFTLPESGSVSGQVTRASGAPLTAPALVYALPRNGTASMGHVETDAQGRYELELGAGVYQLVALPPSAPIYFHAEEDPAVTVPAGAAVRQDLTLKEDTGALSGTVLEPSGAPSPLAVVAAIQGGDFAMTLRVRADEVGHFALPQRPPNASPLELVAFNGGRMGRLQGAREGHGDVTVRLQPSATLRGRVVAASGAPPDGFTLELRDVNGEELPWAQAWPTTRRFPGDTFSLPDAPGQPVKVTVRTEDGRTGEAQVTLTPGGSAEVEVPLTGGASSISGRAVWSRGGAAAGVAVFLDRPVSSTPDARTGPEGRFRLDDVRPGSHTVRLWPPEGRVETRTVRVAAAQASDLGDVTVSPRRTTPGTLGAGFSEDRGYVTFAWLTPDGPAALAGVSVGDRLVSVDGQVVRDRAEAESRTRGTPGSPVRLQLRRTGMEQELLVTRAP
ncbi:carboxypeptidase regulatory-like domain-containing protein [Pyxidicoccus parkwayensis]|uniref:Carboxypeptidase regulatory-like domain-containing protein n=2 Tax=Pyxidicoccus parkwayensis TaxID=2813578 RepID=A0ABX7PD94_9BACT|nr:carboxypeptidase regulatory-like domain-containing protein [Pyxidicoccus parkwaysis]